MSAQLAASQEGLSSVSKKVSNVAVTTCFPTCARFIVLTGAIPIVTDRVIAVLLSQSISLSPGSKVHSTLNLLSNEFGLKFLFLSVLNYLLASITFRLTPTTIKEHF
jgi:hypothetical protein